MRGVRARPVMNAPFSLTGTLYEKENGFDEYLGTRSLNFSAAGLAGDLGAVGAAKNYTSDFTGAGAHYRVTYQVKRVF